MSENYLSRKEFIELDDSNKWHYVLSLSEVIDKLKIQAEKNCSECEMLAPDDININLLFEDFRECQNNCDECGKEERVYMCDLQLQIVSHISEAVYNLRNKLNGLVKAVLRKDDTGEQLLANLQKSLEEKKAIGNDMFL